MVRTTRASRSAFGIIGGAPYHLVKTLEQKPNLQVAVNETTQTQYLYMRIDKAPFDNLKVRQAIAHAINKQEVSSGRVWSTCSASRSSPPHGRRV
jgi:peptide/nickel transport system substrate-binding protein